jgi:hypothetical protein
VGIREANRSPLIPRYTLIMSLALDPATEQRIQRELDRGPYREAAELINHALDVLNAEESSILCNKAVLDQRLEESMAQIERGEGIPDHQLLQYLAAKRQSY